MTSFVYFGGAEGDRTPDPKTASLVLSQLSYSPIFFPATARSNVTSRPNDVKGKYRIQQPLTVLRQWVKLPK